MHITKPKPVSTLSCKQPQEDQVFETHSIKDVEGASILVSLPNREQPSSRLSQKVRALTP
jgi:hypothetical protein